ncbi:MAG TPA: N-acetylneuraminate synthase family protein [Alphaproteobacteria bacterium]
MFGKDPDADVIVVAEIGVNHEGDPDAALALLKAACAVGAHAAKLQTYTPSRYASASDPARLARVTKFALDPAAHRRLAKAAAEMGLPLFSTAVTEDVVPLLDSLFPVIKIASGDITFEPVIRAAARTGKPVILSTGLATMGEVEQAVGWVRAEVGADALRERLLLMHCVSAYPTPPEQANLLSIPYLASRTGLRVGYSNHVLGLDACFAAIALGACVIEAHFTDRRSGRTFRDHELSLEPGELAQLVQAAPRWRAMRGGVEKAPQPCEIANREIIRKGLVAARPLAAGTVLAPSDLAYSRPATEFAATDLDRLVGRRLKAAVGAGELIRRQNVD